ncbi:glutamine-hydrolyzing GMP synthase [Candidatus Roizmanbacteria bacterium CG09_land_8_20_14_0_10_41_9]|uniref:GMP synthase [glutamine-hydrolyzing] n=1 Tax=Candidatus Roizmanbacteria bacterium CG09_land_8_20_14_0_10_41_9 TaxID=1974850 RepID=A0A2H0WSM2_9BACT|nr:MAG: glutamine-hydrolyzing GMP synthase [Candidatus Roizmanbacteria bacterium CG09_land_8_20_14_0_10_41_9]
MIVLVDFGSQTTHLIARRIRELGADVEIISPEIAMKTVRKQKPDGIILSGGPASVYDLGAPTIDPTLLNLGIPILGICYGEQLISHLLGGKVRPGKKQEFGPARLTISSSSPLLRDVQNLCTVWMSHGDEVIELPKSFIRIANTETIPNAAIENRNKKIFGIQFHPEVIHTQFGIEILRNFLSICRITPKKQEVTQEFIKNSIQNIRDSVGKGKAICALSGGVDSSVAALLIHQAIGNNLTAIYVDSGLMRQGETDTLRKTFETHYHMRVKIVRAQKLFLKNLRGITNPEKKRIIIGNTFIKVLERQAKRAKAEFLVQGTIYPDVIESAGTTHSKKIKSHHNVAGLPKRMKLILLEPLRQLYKDEVRTVGTLLGLPDKITKRQPFPGPGLAIRIIGSVTPKKLRILRVADAIIQEEAKKAGLQEKLWQMFAVFTGIKTTGVRGDNRAYGETIAIRAIEARDAMTAHFSRLPYNLLDTIATRIVNEIPEVNRVVYDITNKPPATMEWE